MKLINLFDEVINGNISEDVVFEMYGEKFEGINELGYEKGLSRRLLMSEVELIEDKPKEDKKIEKLDLIVNEYFTNELQAIIQEIQVKINEIIDKING